MRIWVDADSCPRPVRETVLRASKRTGVEAFFVANRPVPGIREGGPVRAILVEAGPGAADDYLVARAEPGDLAVTRDVPLAARLIEKGIEVLDDRGNEFNESNIAEKLSVRNFMLELDRAGLTPERLRSHGPKELKSFADRFDAMLQAALKRRIREDRSPGV